MISILFAALFGWSLLPGRRPLCLRFAERISDGILPDGAIPYCRRLTWVWLFVLLANAALSMSLLAVLPNGATVLGLCPVHAKSGQNDGEMMVLNINEIK